MPTPEDMIEKLKGSDDPDAMVLLEMARLGADLRKPHEPEFAFEVRDMRGAEVLRAALSERGYGVECYEPDSDNASWQVIAKRTMVLDLDVMNCLTREFELLAMANKASYDGWGAEIVE